MRALAVDEHLALARLDQVADDPQQRRLAAAGRSDQGDELARLDVEVDPVEREHVAALEALREPGDRDGGGFGAHATCSGARRTSSRSAIATTEKKMIPSPAAMMFVAQRLSGEVM